MKSVFLVQHSYESSLSGDEEIKLIGVYSSKQKANDAVCFLSKQPGFKDFADYFFVEEYQLDETNWQEGFVTENYEPTWTVWRHDDNDNTFLVKSGLTESDALSLVREYEAKGHKQTYWAKENK